MDLDLKSRTAVVSGASIGIGRAIAKALALEGVRVVGVARRRELLDTLAQEVKAAGGVLIPLTQDIMQEDAAATIAAAAIAELGHVDILVNNAGGSRPLPIDAPDSAWDEAMSLNFTRYRQVTHALLPQMIERKWGRIVNITGKSEPEGLNAAFAAKAAVHAWAKGPVARDRTTRHHRQQHPAGPHHERSRSGAITRKTTAGISPRKRSRCATGANPKTSPHWSCSSPRLWRATSPARSSPSTVASGATSFSTR